MGNEKDPARRIDEKEYTPLNKPIYIILKKIKDKPFFRHLEKLKAKRSQSRKYNYHNDHDHDTDKCFALKDFLDEQIKKGNIGQYVKAQLTLMIAEGLSKNPSGSKRHVVNIVIRGSTSGGSEDEYVKKIFLIEGHQTKNVKPSLDNMITFSDEDYGEINPRHVDDLVVKLNIANQNVVKILVDNGSSVNILYYHAYNRMFLDGYEIELCREPPLYGFGNNLVPIHGTINLPVVFGIEPCQVETIVKFYVINGASSYNAILGRPTLANLRVITSITHMKMKFPTPYKVGEVRDNQQTSRVCYSTALK